MAELPNGAGPTLLTTASTTQTIYTAPATDGTWAILRTIHVANELDTSCKVTVGRGTTNTDAAGKRLVRLVQLQPGQTWEWSGFLYLPGGDGTPAAHLVYALCDIANGATVTVGVVEGP